ncbi:MAG TPA: glycosyltransferase, partial [Desulfobulbus sp.]|nr:glycosyltransferase [Desulfobulbus sp.]
MRAPSLLINSIKKSMHSRYLGFADRRLLIRYPAAVTDIVEFLFAQVPAGRDREPDHVFLLERDGGKWALIKDGKHIGREKDEKNMANLLMGEIIYAMIDGVHSGLTLHAGAVAWKNKGIWLPGTSGAGKSSLSAWLCTQGFSYLTDELIHCPFGSLRFDAFTRPLNFKNHGLDALTALLPDTLPGNDTLAGDAVTMAQPEVFGQCRATMPELAFLLFPTFEQGADLELEPMSPAQAGLQLMGCHVNARNLPGHGFAEVVKLCRQVPACRLIYGSFQQLENRLDSFLELALDSALTTSQVNKLAGMVTAPQQALSSSEADRERKKKILPATPQQAKKKLTIGMAVYDDYDGAYFSVQAIGLYHQEVRADIEILVIDNHPQGADASALKKLECLGNYRYVPFKEKTGTAIRDRIFAEASGDFVLCMDCHVLIVPGALARLLAYFDKHPLCNDLLQGPLLNDDLRTMSTHFAQTWQGGMFGVWAYDNRA